MAIKRFKCVCSYDGHNYAGWQRQDNALGIQEVIEDILTSKTKQNITIVSSGRTDALVHAYAQVFHFDSEFYLKATDYQRILNSFLPKDIYISEVEEVDLDFHARFSAISKEYVYKINLDTYNPFYANYMLQSKFTYDLDLMKECSKVFIGEHDFSSFCSNNFNTHPDQVRNISKIEFKIIDSILEIEFIGNGFLRYMVRMIVAAILEVGRKRITIREVEEMLEAKDKNAFKLNSPANGLYLKKVNYK